MTNPRAPRKTAAKKSSGAPSAASSASSGAYSASIYPGVDETLPDNLSQPLAKLQVELGLPVWMLLQGDSSPRMLNSLDNPIVHLTKGNLEKLPKEPFALIVNSPGGDARSAYLLARLFHRRAHDYVAVVPDAAMSAATLLVLGASRIIMGNDAYLGPIDAQIMDHDTESYGSVLNEIQSLERLRAFSLESIDETMFLLAGRTGKRIDTLLPTVLSFVAESTRPLMEKIDVVHYTERARILKVGEEYAARLLKRNYVDAQAESIAHSLVEEYPEHGFPIDREEARSIGLHVDENTDEVDELLEQLWHGVQEATAVGTFEEKT